MRVRARVRAFMYIRMQLCIYSSMPIPACLPVLPTDSYLRAPVVPAIHIHGHLRTHSHMHVCVQLYISDVYI